MNTVPLAWLWGKPQATGQIKQFPEDFQVEEDLGYRADGAGEHLLLRIRKTSCNTRFVADALARYLKVPQHEVRFCRNERSPCGDGTNILRPSAGQTDA